MADLVVSDGAPDVTGLHAIDEYLHSQLLLAAFNITTHVLRKGGNFCAKMFKTREALLLTTQMQVFFKSVQIVKPRSSRPNSAEAFLVCLDYDPPQGFLPFMYEANAEMPTAGSVPGVVPFLVSGDLSGIEEGGGEESKLPASCQRFFESINKT
ncbi:hypothetical protein HDU97_005524 [Phlyctochytrium planicorne]|nr:hypothetical protein HDU97_005524 [Phlyctochytrium planicorne]